MMIVEQIAEIIRRVDGDHSMGAAVLADAIVHELGLAEEAHPNVPEWEPAFDGEGNPIMDDRFIQPQQKNKLMWVAKRRWVTPWEEVGERKSSAQLSAGLNQDRS
jgi:hypothetical protein